MPNECKPQFVYIIGSSRDGPLKVGIASHPPGRLGELQVGNPNRLRLYWVYACPHGKEYEPLIHRILAPHRMAGEWFAVPIEAAMAALWIASNGGPATNEELAQWREHVGFGMAYLSADEWKECRQYYAAGAVSEPEQSLPKSPELDP